MHMVSPDRITKLAERHYVKGSAHLYDFASHCYDEGMVEILREVARKELFYNYEPQEPSVEAKEAAAQVQKHYQLLAETLNEAQKEKLESYGEACQTLNALETGEEFIHGFIQGYQYLKEQG